MSTGSILGVKSAAALLALAMTSTSPATWSIVIADSETKEVAVGTVTCVANLDLLALVPVVVVGKGAAAVQAVRDFDGIRRPIIFAELMAGTSPQDILTILEGVEGHQLRAYGICDTNGQMVSFIGSQVMDRAFGSIVGSDGTMVYAIQGGVLAGDCVLPAIEAAILGTAGDMPQKLMAGMQAARVTGGDGRCSCSPNNPTGCGCPPPPLFKSGHIGTMVVARIGDTDDLLCNAGGCADGDYFMKFNVPFQGPGDPDPVIQLQNMFDEWRADLVGRPDAVQSVVVFDPEPIPPNGVAMTTMQISLLDWQGKPITQPINSLAVSHARDSAGLSTIGRPVDNGDGTFSVPITAGTRPGVDRFIVEVDDGIRPVTLAPNPTLEYFALGDLNGDGCVGILDLLMLLANWGACPDPCPPSCSADLDGDCTVGIFDLLTLLANWG
ncbi:MAG: DUF1028 domain-containing protein [Planctomycetes bacterium]|nr:DUF1028 domain-containing protein [Planctomycetota bacterium]